MKKTIILLVFMVASACTMLFPKGSSYAEISKPFVEVVFNSNGGTAVETQLVRVGDKVEKPSMPIDTIATDIFAGWYYLDNGSEVVWDFENTINKSITLYAKWVNLECQDYSRLSQTLGELKPVDFYINTTETVIWFVNNERQYGVVGNKFTFYTPESGSYIINCRVGGVESKQYLVAIDYYIPEELNVSMEVSDDNLFTFQIENGQYMKAENCTWYCSIEGKKVETIGTGIKCVKRLSKNCKVFAVYQNGQDGDKVVSRNLYIEPEFDAPTTLYILIAAGVGVGILVTFLVIISKKRYKDYY